MALADIDAAATRRLIQEIADEAKAGFAAAVARSAELDVEAREAAAKDEADLKAALDRRDELAAAEAAAKTAEEKAAKADRPATLTLGAEELRETRPAEKAQEPAQSEAKQADKSDEKQDEKRPSRTLRLGARDEGDDEPPRPRPRPASPKGDDDMSGRTWLR